MTLPAPPDDHSPTATSFAGQTVVFTGKLALLGRRAAWTLVERLGGVAEDEVTARTTILVVGDEGLSGRSGQPVVVSNLPRGNGEKSNKLRKAEEANAKSPGCVQILNEEDFCRLGGLRSSESLKSRYHSLRQIRELYPLVRETRLEHLKKWGLIRPVIRTNADTYYSFTDIAVVKRVHEELRQGRSFRTTVRALLAAREGQLALNFGAVRSDAQPAKVVELRHSGLSKVLSRTVRSTSDETEEAQVAMAARFFLEGSELDEGSESDQERARTAYRKALSLDPDLVPALVNLANIYYARDELVEAEALYCRALTLDTDCFEAYFNLGNIHHDLGRYEEAVAYYHDALRLYAGYADAHFYLAVTLEKTGRSNEAKTHWRAYLQLAPDGEWVELAREFSE